MVVLDHLDDKGPCKTGKRRRRGYRGGGHVTVKAEITGIQLKGMQTNTRSWRSQRTDFLLEPPEGGREALWTP